MRVLKTGDKTFYDAKGVLKMGDEWQEAKKEAFVRREQNIMFFMYYSYSIWAHQQDPVQ